MARLRAESKLAVTATPVETRLRDIWSIFNIMMTRKLGSETEFVRRYEPRQFLDELTARIRPILLIRKKSMPEIEIQLPGKSYETATVKWSRDSDDSMTQSGPVSGLGWKRLPGPSRMVTPISSAFFRNSFRSVSIPASWTVPAGTRISAVRRR